MERGRINYDLIMKGYNHKLSNYKMIAELTSAPLHSVQKTELSRLTNKKTTITTKERKYIFRLYYDNILSKNKA